MSRPPDDIVTPTSAIAMIDVPDRIPPVPMRDPSPTAAAFVHWRSLVDARLIGAIPPMDPALRAATEATAAQFARWRRESRRRGD